MILEIIERNPRMLHTVTGGGKMRVTGDTIAFRAIVEQLMNPENLTHTLPKAQGNTGITYKNPLFSSYGLPPLQPDPVGVRMNKILREWWVWSYYQGNFWEEDSKTLDVLV